MPTVGAATLPSVRNSLLFLAAVVLGQWLLLANPGYFSHDELAWGTRATAGALASLPWQSWLDIGTFQYRPLTFNLWLLIAHWLHDWPHLFHGLWVGFGSALAWLLRSVLRRCGLTDALATTAALVFLLNPYAVYVHGWVATLADLIWVGCGLGLAWWLLVRYPLAGVTARATGNEAKATAPATGRSGLVELAVGALAMVLALSAKEAGLALAPLAWLGWLLLGRPAPWLRIAIGLSLPALAYLALRLGVILYLPRPDEAYAWSLAAVAGNIVSYPLFVLIPTAPEVGSTLLASPLRLALAGLFWLALLAGLLRAGWRLAVAFVLGIGLALGPVLILDGPANQYAYGASLLAVALVALAWPRLPAWARLVVVTMALVSVWHGINVQRFIHRAGQVQTVFSPALAAAVAAHGDQTVTIALDHEPERWLYQRLSYDPIAYGRRRPSVQIVTPGSEAMYRAAYNGQLIRVTGPGSGPVPH
ncbi:MAG: hypothetical protein M0Q42_00160 [Xanthomonadales bacterium]|nr:hypothetical protein [Xanthomonadales bacterium]